MFKDYGREAPLVKLFLNVFRIARGEGAQTGQHDGRPHGQPALELRGVPTLTWVRIKRPGLEAPLCTNSRHGA
jgi:hypothetical protein